jgi:hypothetical protein
MIAQEKKLYRSHLLPSSRGGREGSSGKDLGYSQKTTF